MNRSIKLQAWDEDEKRLLQNEEVVNTAISFSGAANGIKPLANFILILGTTCLKWRIKEFTGSLDSVGKEIYEGDVVLWHAEDPFESAYTHKKMIVGWNQRCMQFRLYDFPNEVGEKSGEQFWAEDVKVIGHIFDYENEECRYHLDESVKNLVKPLEPKFEKDGKKTI